MTEREEPFYDQHPDEISCPSCESNENWVEDYATYESDEGPYSSYVCKRWLDNEFGLAETCYQKIWIKDCKDEYT